MKWELKIGSTLILYVVGNSPTIAAVERYIAGTWNNIATPKVYYHNDGYFLVKFQNIADRRYSRPHMMQNRPVIVKVWEADFDLNKEVLRMIPLRIKLPGIPYSYWSPNTGCYGYQ